MSKEEQIDLIAGRIIDEYRKHPLLEWNKIAASKIHSQWFEHYTDEIAELKSQFEQSDKMYSDLLAKKDDFKLKWENSENEIAKLKASKSEANEACLIQEIKKVLYESAKKTEIPSGGFEINIQFEEQAKALINQFKITR